MREKFRDPVQRSAAIIAAPGTHWLVFHTADTKI